MKEKERKQERKQTGQAWFLPPYNLLPDVLHYI